MSGPPCPVIRSACSPLSPWPKRAPPSPSTAPDGSAGPTNARLAQLTGLSVRTVQRASTALRLLGVATEVMRGRQRTRAERFASWRVGDRGRGWASVWALHDSRIKALSPHPEGSHLDLQTSRKSVLTTKHRPKTAGRRVASRRASPDDPGPRPGKQVGRRRAKPALGQAVPHRLPLGADPGRPGAPRVDTARREPADHRLDRHGSLGA